MAKAQRLKAQKKMRHTKQSRKAGHSNAGYRQARWRRVTRNTFPSAQLAHKKEFQIPQIDLDIRGQMGDSEIGTSAKATNDSR